MGCDSALSRCDCDALFDLGVQRYEVYFTFQTWGRKIFSIFRFSLSSDSLPVEAGCKGSKLFRLSKLGVKIFEDFRRCS